jgi:hypothetical protein
MDSVHQDCYVLFVRSESGRADVPDTVEQPLLSCTSYEEARSLQRIMRTNSRDCVIRFVGRGGGGD